MVDTLQASLTICETFAGTLFDRSMLVTYEPLYRATIIYNNNDKLILLIIEINNVLYRAFPPIDEGLVQ